MKYIYILNKVHNIQAYYPYMLGLHCTELVLLTFMISKIWCLKTSARYIIN